MWAASTTYLVGGYLLGVRTDTYDLDTRLRAALERHVADGAPANSNYSLRLDDPADGPATPLRKLYRGQSLDVASRSPGRVIDALLAHLSAWAQEAAQDLVRVDAAAAVGGSRAALLPASLGCHSPTLERRLARLGWSLLDAPAVHLDARDGRLVVEPPRLEIDWQPLASLRDAAPRPATEGAPVAPGRYPIVLWAFPDVRADGTGLSPAEAVLRAVGLSRRPPQMPASRLLGLLADALAGADTVAGPGGPAALAALVADAAARRPAS